MSDITLFDLQGGKAVELAGRSAKLEKELQQLVEANMEALLGVQFLASEYTTGKTHRGRIDSLGIDENGCPVIIEYKRDRNENVINQGLFYLDWLLDHKAEFERLVINQLGADRAETIEWSGARLICIAADFTRYDEHAVKLIERNIDLLRYRYFGESLLLLELVNSQAANAHTVKKSVSKQPPVNTAGVTGAPSAEARDSRRDYHEDRKHQASLEHLALYEQVCDFALSLGDEVQRKELKFYTALKLIRNFLSVQVWAPVRDPSIRLYLHLDPCTVQLEDGFSADMRNKGHWGTGDLEVVIRNLDDLGKAKPLILQSYENS